MRIPTLNLKNFRSYTEHTFEFTKNTTILLGPNTVGKTNVLEAIFLTATGKSFRAETEMEMIYWQEEYARVKSRVILHDGPMDLEILMSTGEVAGQQMPLKRYKVNGIVRRQIDFVGNLRAVLFWPEDLELITDSPSRRRKYLDFVLIQVDREYRRSLLSYEKGLRQRNKLLERIREGEASRAQLMFWDQLLIKTGNYLTDTREAFITAVNSDAKPFGEFHVNYDHSVISESRLTQYAEAEVAAAATLVGPHRDDLGFFVGKRDLSKYGSRGEQRLAILWLKLSELEYVTRKTGERPLLLLDDIFSELDHAHRDEVVRVVGKQQTILTTTDRHFLPDNLLKEAEVVELIK